MRLLLSLLFPSLVLAMPRVETRFVYINGPGSMERPEIESLIKEVKHSFRKELRIDLHTKIIERTTDYNFRFESNALSYFLYLLKKYPYRKPNTAMLYLTPPLIAGEITTYQIMAGVAFINSYPLGAGFCVAESFNSDLDSRFNASLYGAMHELGHELGSRHDPDNSCYIMDPAVASCANRISNLNWSNKSKRAIRARVLKLERRK